MPGEPGTQMWISHDQPRFGKPQKRGWLGRCKGRPHPKKNQGIWGIIRICPARCRNLEAPRFFVVDPDQKKKTCCMDTQMELSWVFFCFWGVGFTIFFLTPPHQKSPKSDSAIKTSKPAKKKLRLVCLFRLLKWILVRVGFANGFSWGFTYTSLEGTNPPSCNKMHDKTRRSASLPQKNGSWNPRRFRFIAESDGQPPQLEGSQWVKPSNTPQTNHVYIGIHRKILPYFPNFKRYDQESRFIFPKLARKQDISESTSTSGRLKRLQQNLGSMMQPGSSNKTICMIFFCVFLRRGFKKNRDFQI